MIKTISPTPHYKVSWCSYWGVGLITCAVIHSRFPCLCRPVKTVCFSLDGLSVISGSDDTSIRNWDLATGSCVSVMRGHEVSTHTHTHTRIHMYVTPMTSVCWWEEGSNGHACIGIWTLCQFPSCMCWCQYFLSKDYVRHVVCSPTSQDVILSSSYDHKLKLWDLRTGTAVSECDHGSPIETFLVFPSGGTGLTAGGNVVRVWDLLRDAGRALMRFSNHQKTITALAFDGSCSRVLSGGLDRWGGDMRRVCPFFFGIFFQFWCTLCASGTVCFFVCLYLFVCSPSYLYRPLDCICLCMFVLLCSCVCFRNWSLCLFLCQCLFFLFVLQTAEGV